MLGFKLALILALAVGSHAVPSFEDFLESLNTTQKLWMYQRNYTVPNKEGAANHECLFATKVYLNNSDYEFTQNFTEGSIKMQTHLYAKLGEDGEGPYMLAGHEEGKSELKYTLRAWYPQDRCGVLTFYRRDVPPQLFTGCELLVWDHFIDGPIEECLKMYNDICRGTTHRVYWMATCRKTHRDTSENSSAHCR